MKDAQRRKPLEDPARHEYPWQPILREARLTRSSPIYSAGNTPMKRLLLAASGSWAALPSAAQANLNARYG